jgi:4-aminobutyrate aminotransferase-like enzyme
MSKTIAECLREDPQLLAAKQQMLDALRRHQSTITGVRAPIAERSQSYAETLARFQEQRAGNLLLPYLGSGLGNGALVELNDGSVKWDFICGIGVYQFGHSNPMIVEAAMDAALQDTLIQGHLQQNRNSVLLTDKILQLANLEGPVFDHCFLSSSGVMSAENALKITFQKKFPAHRIIAFRRCFAGRTLAFSHINDKAIGRAGLPDCFPVDHVPFYDPSDPEGSTEATLRALKALFHDHPGKHAAMIFELVQGEGGFYPGDAAYFRKIMEYCRENGVAVLVDEIQTFARLAKPFAYQFFGLSDLIDVAWIGKASQVCATLFRKDFAPKPGLLGQTYTSGTAMIEGSLRICDALLNEAYFGESGKINRLATYIQERLAKFEKETGLIRGPFGLGSMVAFIPLGGEPTVVSDLCNRLFTNGLICHLAGSNPTKIRFLMPYPVIDTSEIDEVLKILFETLRSMVAERSQLS